MWVNSKRSYRLWILFSVFICFLSGIIEYKIIANSFSHPKFNLIIMAIGITLFSTAYSIIPKIFMPFYDISYRSGELRVRFNDTTKKYLLKHGSPAFLFMGFFRIELNSGRKLYVPFINKKRTVERLEKEGLVIKQPSSYQQILIFIAFGLTIYFLTLNNDSIKDEYLGALILIVVVFNLKKKLSEKSEQVINMSKNIHSLKKKQMRVRTVKTFGALLIASFALSFVSDLPLSEDDRIFYVQSKIFEKHPDAEGLELMAKLASAGFSSSQLNKVAWYYIVVPQMELRDPKRAIELSTLSLKINGTQEAFDTYLCALMADHQNERAIDLAKKIKLHERVKLFKEGNLCEDTE